MKTPWRRAPKERGDDPTTWPAARTTVVGSERVGNGVHEVTLSAPGDAVPNVKMLTNCESCAAALTAANRVWQEHGASHGGDPNPEATWRLFTDFLIGKANAIGMSPLQVAEQFMAALATTCGGEAEVRELRPGDPGFDEALASIDNDDE